MAARRRIVPPAIHLGVPYGHMAQHDRSVNRQNPKHDPSFRDPPALMAIGIDGMSCARQAGCWGRPACANVPLYDDPVCCKPIAIRRLNMEAHQAGGDLIDGKSGRLCGVKFPDTSFRLYPDTSGLRWV